MAMLWAGLHGAWGAPHSYRFEVWNTERGLPQNTVLSIVQSRDGYLWIGTRFGLARFDGVRFTTFNVANTPGMPCENCYAMAEDAEGSLWIGTNEGLMRRKNNQFQLFTTEHNLSHNMVRHVSLGRSGALWAGTLMGFSRYSAGAFTNLIHATGLIHVRTEVIEDRAGCIWYNTQDGLFRMRLAGGKPELIAPGGGDGDRAQFLIEDIHGNVWWGNYRGLFRWNNQGVQRFIPPSQSTLVQCAFLTRSNELFVSVSDRNVLHRFADGRFIPFPGPGGKPIEHVTAGLEDREGNLWIGTRFDGLIEAQHGVASVISKQNGLGNNNVLTVCETRDGSIWTGTSEGTINRIRGSIIESLTISNVPAIDVLSVCEDSSGVLWVGTRKGNPRRSVFRLGPDGPECFNEQLGLESECISAIYRDRSGALWFGTSDGLYCWKDNQGKKITTSDGLSANNVRAVLEDRAGAIWIGTHGGGVNILRNGQLTTLTTKDGLASNRAWSLYEDPEGVMWIGTETGLSRYADGRLFTFKRQHGLFDDLVNCTLEDDLGYFWISCNRGIYRVGREELNAVAAGRAAAARHISYGVSDGMLSSETNGENQPAGWKSRDGLLWFPTIQGLVFIDPRRAQENSVEPTVVIEEVTADDEVMIGNGLAVPRSARSSGDKDFTLGARRGQVLQIQYTANSFVAGERVRFKYRLEGHDRDWRDAGTDRVAYYTNLKPGDYRFQVIAANSHDRWNTNGASFAFSLAPHFSQTAEFWGAVVLAFIGAGVTVHVMRLRFVRRLQRAEQFQAVEMERKRIAKDMHDDLGSRLTHISLLTELATRGGREPDEFRAHLHKIGETTRGVFYSLDEIIWATNPKNDALESLVSFIARYAEDFLRPAGIACRLDFPQSLPALPVSAATRHDLFLAVKEALNNIVKHSGATEVWLQGKWHSSDFELTIRDNGRGLPAENGNGNSHSSDGDGLPNMRQRLRAIGGEISIGPAPAGGTLVCMRIPLGRKHPSNV